MELNLKKEWSEIETELVIRAIRRYCNSRIFYTHEGRLPRLMNNKQTENVLGLAYTSSGIYAGLWVNNVELYLDAKKQYTIHGFAMDNYGRIYAVCSSHNCNAEDLFIIINK